MNAMNVKEFFSDNEIRFKLDELRGELQTRERICGNNEELKDYYERIDWVSEFSPKENLWYCPLEFMSNRLIDQMIHTLERVLKEGSEEGK